jgi:hypothetical protein
MPAFVILPSIFSKCQAVSRNFITRMVSAEGTPYSGLCPGLEYYQSLQVKHRLSSSMFCFVARAFPLNQISLLELYGFDYPTFGLVAARSCCRTVLDAMPLGAGEEAFHASCWKFWYGKKECRLCKLPCLRNAILVKMFGVMLKKNKKFRSPGMVQMIHTILITGLLDGNGLRLS